MHDDDKQFYTKAELETQVSLARVETLISVTRDDFVEHKADDERNFGEIFKSTREISSKIDKIPKTIVDCRDELKTEIHDEISEHFVSLIDFKVFTTKVIWAIVGGTTCASLIAWALSVLYTATKITTGG